MKNRNREEASFANINLLGPCNIDCFFCLGKDIPEVLKGENQLETWYGEWDNFEKFLEICKEDRIDKLYITGLNTDPLCYKYLGRLITTLKSMGFKVGLRTNGYKARGLLDTINKCDLSVGYSIPSINPVTNKMITGRMDIPRWDIIIPETEKPRISIVLNRCNEPEFFDLLSYLAKFNHIQYIQVRKVVTETRQRYLQPDRDAYERIYTQVDRSFPYGGKMEIHRDAQIFEIYGKEVVFWRPENVTVNSYNYFTDGFISRDYFIVESYVNKHSSKKILQCQYCRHHYICECVEEWECPSCSCHGGMDCSNPLLEVD